MQPRPAARRKQKEDAMKREQTDAEFIAELMNAWNKIETAAKAQFPNATREELYKICSGAMNHAIGLGSTREVVK